MGRHPALVLPRIMQAADHYRNEKLAILTTITPVAKRAPPQDKNDRRRTPWTRRSARSAPTTSTRASTGAARCRRSAPWGSISRSASITAACTATGSRRVKQALEKSELGALLVFDVNNIRYITSTKIGEWERDKLCRWALLTRDGEPILWDFGSAAVHHKLYTPWLKPENCKAGLHRPARHRQSRVRADEAPRRGDRLADQARPASPTCRSASTSSSRR